MEAIKLNFDKKVFVSICYRLANVSQNLSLRCVIIFLSAAPCILLPFWNYFKITFPTICDILDHFISFMLLNIWRQQNFPFRF